MPRIGRARFAARIIRTDPKKEEFDLADVPTGKKPKNSEIGGIAGGLEFVNFDDVAKAKVQVELNRKEA